ncbi:two component transcriptional regulator, LuxR family [Actinobacteria bacterium OK074]|nr:two component transcriptional regulator, LuxR family [Actinobacteria bacterium OK074]
MPDQAVPGPPLRVLVADDNPVVRAGLSALLGTHPDMEVVAEASDGDRARTLTAVHRPDVVLLDVRMPGTDGLTALPELARTTRVLMLTYSAEPQVVAEALRRGASGYLVHGDFTAAELATAVRQVSRGGSPLSPCVALRPPTVLSRPGTSHETVEKPSRLQPVVAHSWKGSPARVVRLARTVPNRLDFGLSSREVEVMDLIATGMSNRQIAAACFISEKTVKNHINRIFAKLHSATRSEAIAHWLGTTREGWPA